MNISRRALALAGVAALVVASFIAWLAVAMTVDSRNLTTLCGTTMSNVGIAQMSSALVMAGMLALAGLVMLFKAWRLRRSSAGTEPDSAVD